MKNAEKPLLSISLLASNRLDTIPRCLESLKPIREALPCELIIVDTSNNPEVHECILKYTDMVESFEWCNDFSKARNVGLKKAKGDWFMFLDDDEWFLDSTPIIEFFKSGEYKNYGFAYYQIRNYKDTEFYKYVDAWVMRLVKMQNDIKFHSKVHEYIAPYFGEGKQIDAWIGHSGYIYKTQEEKIAHFERNSSLLERMEAEEPDNLRWKVHLIQEYYSMEDWERLEEYGKKTIDYIHSKNTQCLVIELMQIYIGYVKGLSRNNRHEEIKLFYEKYHREAESSLLAKSYLDFIMALSYYVLKEYELTEKHASAYLKSYEMYQEDPTPFKEEEVHIIINGAFSDKNNCSAQTLLLLAILELGKYDKIREIYQKMNWGSQHQRLFYNVHIKLIDTLLDIKDYELLKTFLKDSLVSKQIAEEMRKTILSWKQKDEDEFSKILELVKEINIWEWYKLYIELFSRNGMPEEEVKKIAVSFIRQTPNVFQVPNTINEALKNHSIEMESLYTELDFITWKKQLTEHFECMNMEQLETLKDTLTNSSLNTDVRYFYFMMLYAEQKLLNNAEIEMNVDAYSEVLKLFSHYTCKTYEVLYGAEIQNMEPEQLPGNYQAALWLQIYFEEVDRDLKAALSCLGKVAEVYPFLQKCITVYLNLIKNLIIS